MFISSVAIILLQQRVAQSQQAACSEVCTCITLCSVTTYEELSIIYFLLFQTDIKFEMTLCDANNGFWRVAVPTNESLHCNIPSSKPPRRVHGCGESFAKLRLTCERHVRKAWAKQ